MWRRIHSRLYSDGIENGSNRNGVVEGDSKPKPFNVASCDSCRPIRKERDRARRRCRSRNGMTRGIRPSLPFYPARACLKESPLPLLHRLHLLYPRSVLPARSHFISSSQSKSASERERGRSLRADLLLLRESRRRRRRGFHLFEPERRGLQLRNAFADEIVRPSVMLAASFLPSSSFPSRGDEAIGFPEFALPFLPSVLCLCLPSPRTAPSKAFAAAAAI